MPSACFKIPLLALTTLALVWAGAAGQQKQADVRQAFFRKDAVVHLTIDLDKKELDSLRRDPRKYAKATLKEGDQVAGKDVGVHLRGAAGSFRGIDDKPGLTLNMDKFAKNQLFHGLDKFYLANSVQDPSYLAELICGDLYRAAGVPASRVSHALVTINGRKRGLYYLKEGYDTEFLKHHFQVGTGNFYDGGFLRDIDQRLQFLSGTDDVKDQADLKALLAAAREPNVKLRYDKLDKVLDVDRFASYLALQVITWDWDGYPMNRNNYRIYHDPKRDKLVFLPSGMDQMFANPDGPIIVGFQGLVASAFMETPQGKKRYLERMDEIMRTVFKADELGKRLDELERRLQPALASVDPGAARDHKNHVNHLKQAIQTRAKSVAGQLKKMQEKK